VYCVISQAGFEDAGDVAALHALGLPIETLHSVLIGNAAKVFPGLGVWESVWDGAFSQGFVLS